MSRNKKVRHYLKTWF